MSSETRVKIFKFTGIRSVKYTYIKCSRSKNKKETINGSGCNLILLNKYIRSLVYHYLRARCIQIKMPASICTSCVHGMDIL